MRSPGSVALIALVIAAASVGVLATRCSDESIAAPRATEVSAMVDVAPVPIAGDAAVEQPSVRVRAPAPLLDQFEADHAEAVGRLLAEHGTLIVECLVLGPTSNPLRLLCRETDAAKGVAQGDLFSAYTNDAYEQRQLHIDPGFARIRPGEIRPFLLQRVLWKTQVRIPGRVKATLDFAAMRNACAWEEARAWIGRGDVSVLEGTLTVAPPSRRARQTGVEESLLTIERVHWSPVGWRPADTHVIRHFPLDDADEETRLLSCTPPRGVPLFVLVSHDRWILDGMLLRARIR